MPSLYALCIGPIPTGDGEGMLFMGLFDGKLVPTAMTGNADAALADLRRQVPAGTRLQCLPELGLPGVRNGFHPTPPDEEALAARAQLAFVLAHSQIVPKAASELFPLLQAAARFWDARPWERLPSDVPLLVEVSGAVRGTHEAAVMGAAGEEFGIALYPNPGSIARLIQAMGTGRPDRVAGIDAVSLTYNDGPSFAAWAIAAWCGLPKVPLTFGLRSGRMRPIDAADALTLAVTLHAFSGMQGVPGETVSHTLSSGDHEVAVTVRIPVPGAAMPPRPRRPRRPRR